MPANLDDIDHKIRQGVDEGTIPRFLYKYKNLQPTYALEFLTKSELYFSTPKELNDPFDCQVNIDTDNTVVGEVNNWLRRGLSWVPKDYYKFRSEFFVANKEEMDRRANIQSTEFFNRSGILCFTGDQTNLLMWSHYGDYKKNQTRLLKGILK